VLILVFLGLFALKSLADTGSERRVHEAYFVDEIGTLVVLSGLVLKVVVQDILLLQDELVDIFKLQQHGRKLLEVIEMILKECQIPKLTSHLFEHVQISQLGVRVKFWIVHREIERLLVVQDSYELCSSQVRFIVIDDEQVPLVRLNICNFDAVALYGWRIVVFGKHSIQNMITWVDVALETSIAFTVAVEKHGQIVWVKSGPTFSHKLEFDG
jgi:hypothetical protein